MLWQVCKVVPSSLCSGNSRRWSFGSCPLITRGCALGVLLPPSPRAELLRSASHATNASRLVHLSAELHRLCAAGRAPHPGPGSGFSYLAAELDVCAPSSTRRDSVDFVQQGALIALALVLAEQPESRAKPLREHINRLYGNKAAEVGCWQAAEGTACGGVAHWLHHCEHINRLYGNKAAEVGNRWG